MQRPTMTCPLLHQFQNNFPLGDPEVVLRRHLLAVSEAGESLGV